MIKVEEKEEIRKLYFRKRWSIRKIARELHHSRKTVRRALNDPYPPVYRRKTPPPERILGPVKHIIDTYLKEDEKRPKKQRHTARRIYHRLVEEHSFKGSESTVRRYVRELRGKQKEVFIPLEYDPGSFAQADWGEAYVIMRGVKTLVKIFCMKLCSSKKPFIYAFPFEKQEAFSEVKIQRCTVHKLRNIANHCPRAIQGSVMADVKRVIYATSKKKALEEFQAWKRRYQDLAPKAVACLEKDLAETLEFLDFPYRMWVSLRTTNVIERVFREFRRRNQGHGYFSHRRILYPDYVFISSK